jgi:hypothetical protein
VSGVPLLTREPTRYRTSFPKLALIALKVARLARSSVVGLLRAYFVIPTCRSIQASSKARSRSAS